MYTQDSNAQTEIWTAYSGKKTPTRYLLSWRAQLNWRDGLDAKLIHYLKALRRRTPLHGPAPNGAIKSLTGSTLHGTYRADALNSAFNSASLRYEE
jgi:hypothetical protein